MERGQDLHREGHRTAGPAAKAPRIIASAEAGIGGGVSYDGGVTWQGFMVPGGPNDSSPASLAHPGKALNLQGYSDPWAVSMKDGRVGVAYIGFTRDKVTGQSTQSGIFFTRYRDRNASDAAHDWEYEFSSQVSLSQNLTQGQFLDKVSATVGPTGTLYVAYTRFTGSSGSSNIFLAQSTDGGRTWTSASIDKDAKYGQGTVALVHPTDAAAVGVLWRTFVSSSLIFKSTAKGAKNVDLFLNDPGGPYKALRPVLPGDQRRPEPGRLPHAGLPVGRLHARRQRLVVVFPEWINLEHEKPGTTGRPMPMVVMKVSTDRGATWSRRYVLNWTERRGAQRARVSRAAGLLQPDARPVGAQLMPAVACTVGNQCMVVWKQSYSGRDGRGRNREPGLARDLRHRPPVRRARGPGELPGTRRRGTASFQVSRYGYRELGPTETPGQVRDTDDWVAKMELPNGTTYPMFDWGNLNHSGAGRVAFAGDYIGVKEVAAPAPAPRSWWRSPTTATTSGPTRRRRAGACTPGEEWRYYPVFMAPDDPENKVPGVSCVNYGSRVQSVMTAKVAASGLLLTAADQPQALRGGPAGLRRPGRRRRCIEFPLNVRNNTGVGSARSPSLPLRLGLVRQAPLRRDARRRDELRLPAPDGEGDDLPVLQLLPERLRVRRQPRDRQGHGGDRHRPRSRSTTPPSRRPPHPRSSPTCRAP